MGWYVDDRGVIAWKPGDENPDHDHQDESVDMMDVDGGIPDENDQETSNPGGIPDENKEGTSNPNGTGHVHENPNVNSDDNAVDGVSGNSEPLKNQNGKRNVMSALLAKLKALIFR